MRGCILASCFKKMAWFLFYSAITSRHRLQNDLTMWVWVVASSTQSTDGRSSTTWCFHGRTQWQTTHEARASRFSVARNAVRWAVLGFCTCRPHRSTFVATPSSPFGTRVLRCAGAGAVQFVHSPNLLHVVAYRPRRYGYHLDASRNSIHSRSICFTCSMAWFTTRMQ